jgi:hypothetical protein
MRAYSKEKTLSLLQGTLNTHPTICSCQNCKSGIHRRAHVVRFFLGPAFFGKDFDLFETDFALWGFLLGERFPVNFAGEGPASASSIPNMAERSAPSMTRALFASDFATSSFDLFPTVREMKSFNTIPRRMKKSEGSVSSLAPTP